MVIRPEGCDVLQSGRLQKGGAERRRWREGDLEWISQKICFPLMHGTAGFLADGDEETHQALETKTCTSRNQKMCVKGFTRLLQFATVLRQIRRVFHSA